MRPLFTLKHLMTAAIFLFPLMPGMAAASQTTSAGIYQHFSELLDTHLEEKTLDDNGLVSAFDYQAAFESSPSMSLVRQQRRALQAFDTDSLQTREQSIAFWINAYNFFMIAQILEEPVDDEIVDSVWDYGGRYNPFAESVFEFRHFDIGGKKYSLNQMEKQILLGEEFQQRGWKDARVHFAVNCASVGCPPLRKAIYTADNLDALLEENTRRAFNTPRHLRIEGDVLHLSSLFKWYEQDYIEAAGSVLGFVRKHAARQIVEQLPDDPDIRYLDYSWELNRPENFPAF